MLPKRHTFNKEGEISTATPLKHKHCGSVKISIALQVAIHKKTRRKEHSGMK
jgi:hypothetical protein